MKLLTILIFSGDRFNIKELLNDISKLNLRNINVRVVEWSENKSILRKKNKIYNFFKKFRKNFKVYYQKGNWEYKYSKYINKFNSKYILVIGDDDRINVKNFEKLEKYLKNDLSGITLSFQNFKKKEDIKFLKDLSKTKIRPFNLFKDLNKIGFTSCQIINVNFIKKIIKKEKQYLLKTKLPQNFIILRIIKKYGNWKILEKNCIYNQLGSFDNLWIKKNLLIRLKSEYLGYFIPLKKYYPNLKDNDVDKIYKHIFFKNIISWLFLSIRYFGKKKTFENIRSERKILQEPIIIKFFLFIIYLSPFFLLNLLRICRRILLKINHV